MSHRCLAQRGPGRMPTSGRGRARCRNRRGRCDRRCRPSCDGASSRRGSGPRCLWPVCAGHAPASEPTAASGDEAAATARVLPSPGRGGAAALRDRARSRLRNSAWPACSAVSWRPYPRCTNIEGRFTGVRMNRARGWAAALGVWAGALASASSACIGPDPGPLEQRYREAAFVAVVRVGSLVVSAARPQQVGRQGRGRADPQERAGHIGRRRRLRSRDPPAGVRLDRLTGDASLGGGATRCPVRIARSVIGAAVSAWREDSRRRDTRQEAVVVTARRRDGARSQRHSLP